MPKRVALAPFQIGLFTLTETGMDVDGTPTFGAWQGVGDYIKRAHKASGFWLADWLRYGESRKDWEDRLGQAVDVTELSPSTLRHVRAAGRVAPGRRRPKVDFSLHLEVSGLTDEEQAHWLQRCEDEGWSVRDLRDAIKQSKREVILEGQADEVWTIEVSVQLEVEGATEVNCEDYAWELVKGAVATIPTARVVASNARPK